MRTGSSKPGTWLIRLDRLVAGGPALAAGRQVDPRLVRHQRVLEVEGGLRSRLRIAPTQPWKRAGRPLPASRSTQHAGPPRARARADVRRAHRRRRLDLEDLVAEPVHHVEDARLVAADVGRRPLSRRAAVEDRGHRLEGRVVDGVAVREPGGDRGQLREVGEALGVDAPVRARAGRPPGTRRRRRTTTGGRRSADSAGSSSPGRLQPGEQQRRGQLSCEPAAPSPPSSDTSRTSTRLRPSRRDSSGTMTE